MHTKKIKKMNQSVPKMKHFCTDLLMFKVNDKNAN